MRGSSRPALILLVICAFLYALYLHGRRMSPAYPDVGVRTEGGFTLGGQYVGEPLAHAALRCWGSWSGADANEGSLTIGPLAAPPRLRFGVTGFPLQKGIELFVEAQSDGSRIAVIPDANVGSRWNILDVDLPAAWKGKPIKIVAIDHAQQLGGWVGISEPLRGGRGDGTQALIETLSGWTINGLLLGVLWLAAYRWIEHRAPVEAYWLPTVAAGIVAFAGYLAFWFYFLHPIAGRAFSIALFVAAAFRLGRRGPDRGSPSTHVEIVAGLMLTIGVFYIADLHLFDSSREIHTLAANRFHEKLPGDNTLPQVVAKSLYEGKSLRDPYADWLSSDRPPLESAWQLLTWPVTNALDLDSQLASYTAAMWLQMLWVPVAYAMLGMFNVPMRRAAAWVAVMALSAFFLQHTVFVWPKMSAGAFVCAAFCIWMQPGPSRTKLYIGAGFAALAWLSHGGVAFSLVAAFPWLLAKAVKEGIPRWISAAVLFVALVTPWLCYQKFYDPPGNRLLKWHLAGQMEKTPLGTWATIRTAYAKRSPHEIVRARLENLRFQVAGDWTLLWDFSKAKATQRRDVEFFITFRALGWWLLGVALLPAIGLTRAWSRAFVPIFRLYLGLFLWNLLTILVWVGLLFTEREAVIHQGSYAVLLSFFVLLATAINFAGVAGIVTIALLQGLTLATTWLVPNAAVTGPLNLIALALAIAALAGMFLFSLRDQFKPPSRIKSELGKLRSRSC